MKHTAPLLLLALLAGSTQALTAKDLEDRLSLRLTGDRSGACVQAAVIDRGQVTRAMACAGTRQDGPPAPDASFEIGSVTKTMTAALVAGLIEQGRWSLDDPIAKHLPAGSPVPRQGERQILVRDLLTHSSGLPALPPGMPITDPANPYADLDEAGLLASLKQVQLSHPIGSQASYSNYGMMLLSLSVARASGGDLEATLRDQLFKPLGMSSAHIGSQASISRAQGHLPGGESTKAWTVPTNLAGVGMVRASLDDMVRYAQAQLGLHSQAPESLVKVLRQTQAPLAHGFGMNWMRRTVQQRELLLHEGGTGGFSSLLALDPSRSQAVVVLADTALSDLGGLGDLGLSLLGLDQPLQPRRAVPTPPVLRQAMAGDYQMGGMRIKVWVSDGGKLMAQAQGQSAFELAYDSRGDFYPLSFSALFTPTLRGDQVVGGLWRQGGGAMEVKRLGASTALSIQRPEWQPYAGRYPLMPGFSLAVFEEDGQLKVRGSGQPAIPATLVAPDRIEIKAVGAVLVFERDAQGQVSALTLQQGGQSLKGPRQAL